ncbi:uncharacterized protein LOC143249848 isoform X2 [Tachypleus tridentatus]|uniref:uncharacterized protein LOC143249848 isoform X2 n=1 Tax=Tachypleus tridentatus TaxID=6853 RepID=UPI003FD5A000
MQKQPSHLVEERLNEDLPQSSLSEDFVLSSRQRKASAAATTILTKSEMERLYAHCDEYYIDENEKRENSKRRTSCECADTRTSTDLGQSRQDDSATAREENRRASTESLKAAGRKLRKISREFHFKYNPETTDET